MNPVEPSIGIQQGSWRLRTRTPTRRRERASGRIIAVALGAISVFTLSPISVAQANPPGEYELKAAFLFNFAKFVNWPPDAFPNANATINLCIWGDDPFGGV